MPKVLVAQTFTKHTYFLYIKRVKGIRPMNCTLNRVNLTQDEETCILHFLRQARECGYPSSNEPWYPVINSIMRKYYDSDVKEAQELQFF